jgi:hypothetical protein
MQSYNKRNNGEAKETKDNGVTAFATSKSNLEEAPEKQDFIWMQSEAEIIYQQYEPSNSQLMREYIQFLISQTIKINNLSLLGDGNHSQLSSNL